MSQFQKEMSPSEMIDERIREPGDWRGDMLAKLRSVVRGYPRRR